MSCIKQRTIVNRHYVKVAGSVSRAEILFRGAPDLYLLVDCGRCLPCQRKRANVWRQRLVDEFNYFIESNPDVMKYKVYFVTLTIAPQYYKRDISHAYDLFKHFRERYRKIYGVSLRYWVTTEYGEKRGRLHFHAIFFNPLCDANNLRDLWKYGRCDMSVVGCSLKNPEQDPIKGIAYVTKYITKTVDKWFINWDDRSRIWCSPGLGLRYCLDDKTRNFHNSKGGLFFRLDPSGKFPQALPRYYAQKIFSPLDHSYRRDINIARLHSSLQFPITVGKRIFHSFAPYVDFVNSIGGRVSLLSTQLDKMTVSDRLTYLNQSNYE